MFRGHVRYVFHHRLILLNVLRMANTFRMYVSFRQRRLYCYTQSYCLIEIVWRRQTHYQTNGRIVMFKVFPRTSPMFIDVHLCTTDKQAGLPYGSIWTEILNDVLAQVG